MVSFKKPRLLMTLGISLALMLVMAGCISKDNPTGNNWSDIHPQTFTDSDCFIGGYSFPCRDSISGNESNLLSANYEGSEAVSFMRFTGLPNEGEFEIPDAYQDSTYLELTLVKRSPLERNPVELFVYKLDQSWAADSTDMISDANLTQITFDAFTIPDSVSTDGTIVQLPLPLDEIENWHSDSDTLGLSLAVKTGMDSYVEILAAETGRGPKIRFKYRNDGDDPEDEDSEYAQRATRDSYRVVADQAPLQADVWEIANISPSRMYVNFLLDYAKFTDMQGVVLDSISRKRATINHAELVFFVKENPYYTGTRQYSLRGDRVEDSVSVAIPAEIPDDDIASGLISQALVQGDSVAVNITPIIQAFSSGDKENWGVVIRSMQEMLNFGKLELWHFTDAPEEKKPKLRVTYTPPFL
ncbi:MAG: hypothetical protein ACP5F3_04075 [Candidatus Syntrophosphaera sp.]